jgi:nicotinamidase-related amidase
MEMNASARRSRGGLKTSHRDAPSGGVALLIIDMINRFDFEGGQLLKRKAARAAEAILALRGDVEAAGYPVVYVNDNFGEWHSEKSRLVESAIQNDHTAIGKIAPTDADFFIIKPQFSGFYATNLPVLLPKLGVSRLILTGIATDICVLFTAADAHMRDYALWVPADCVAAPDDQRSRWALEIMRNSMEAEIAASTELSVCDWLSRLDPDDPIERSGSNRYHRTDASMFRAHKR